ncbi:MAG: 2,3-bisphosphoglycerate-independent phosphoglycerate mutase [Candidatus Aenigmatarchaeota archaeon]
MKRLILIVLDGWALRKKRKGNAIKIAETPNFDSLMESYPNTQLNASGESVGLPKDTLGGSEVGHLHLGAGRVVKQKLKEINDSIDNGSFFNKHELKNIINDVEENDKSLHLMGLLSDGGVHSHIKHLFALLELCNKEGLERNQVKIHCFLDGRDTPPRSAKKYFKQLQNKIDEEEVGQITTISGRYYSMDRDKRWDRTKKAYNAITWGRGRRKEGYMETLKYAYNNDENDEFVVPTVLNKYEGIEDGDGIVLFNFRADRAKQLTEAYVNEGFDKFETKDLEDISFVSMTQYSKNLDTEIVFPPTYVENTMGEILSEKGLRQLRIAETEKEAHVTYFFNGQREKTFEGEDRKIIPSPKVSTYDKKPEMSAFKIKNEVCKRIKENKYDFILINFANGDMVGHTGNFEATIKGVETVDECLGEVIEKGMENNYSILVTADHGNCDEMVNENGESITAHSFNKVPFIIVDDNYIGKDLKEGDLYNVTPTAFEVMNLKKPSVMSEDLLK